MTTFIKKSALRRSINSLLVVAMLFSLVVVPAFAAEPSTAAGQTVTSGGTGLDRLISVDATNGLNGTHSIEITGTVASKTVLKGLLGMTAGKTLQGSLEVAAGSENDLKIHFGANATDEASKTITGLTAASTVGDVLAAINSQVPTLTASLDSDGRVTLTANRFGRTLVMVESASGATDGLAAKLFGTTTFVTGYENHAGGLGKLWTGGNEYGTDYDGAASAFIITDKFISEGTTITAGTFDSTKVGNTLAIGAMNVYGEATRGIKDSNGLYTMVFLANGYGLVLGTTAGGIGVGTAKVDVVNGIRNSAAPKSASVAQEVVAGAAAGAVETMTISIDATGNSVAGWENSVNTIDGLKFELPEGFKIVSGSQTVSHEGTSVVSADGRSLTVSKFALDSDKGTMTVKFASTVPTVAGDFAVKGQYKNIGGGGFKDFEFSGNKNVKVIGLDAVSSVKFADASPLFARAGSIVSLAVQPLDKFGNVVSNSRVVRFKTASTAITIENVGTATGSNGTFTGILPQLKAAEGTATVIVNVFKDDTTITAEATGTIDISTTGVGAPACLQVFSKSNPAAAGDKVTLGVRLLDAAGKTTAFLPTDANKSTSFALNYGPAWNGTGFSHKQATVNVPVRSNFGTVDVQSNVKDTAWEMWAVDATGLLAQSAVVAQTFTSADGSTAAAGSVTADPALVGNAAYGYAYADGTSKVTLTVKTGTPNVTVRAAVDGNMGNEGQAGVINAYSAKTDAAGIAVFTVTSFTSSNGQGYKGEGTEAFFKKFDFTTAEGAPIGSGFAHFYVAKADQVCVDKRVVFADGTDKATVSYVVKNPVTGAAAPGVKLFFSATKGGVSVSPLSATTDADGKVSVAISSKTATDNVAVVATDGNGNEVKLPVAFPSVSFVDYKLVATGALAAQQSAQGAYVRTPVVLVDASGASIAFTRITNAPGISDTTRTAAITTETASFVIEPSLGLVAGDTYHNIVSGKALLTDTFGSAHEYAYAADFFVTIVNNASATARASVLNIVDGNANVSGTGFRANLSNVSVALSADGPSVAGKGNVYTDANGTLATADPFSITGLLPGVYDVWVDGIKFAGGLTVVQGFDIGTTPVYVSLVSDSGSSYLAPNTASKLVGAVSYLGGGSIAGKMVTLFSSAKADGSGAVEIASAITDEAGRFTFNVKPAASTYYFVLSEGDAKVLAGDSRNFGRVAAVFVKTVASLKVTSYPSTATHGKSYTVKGSLPAHAAATTAYVKVYKKSGTKWVSYKSYKVNVAAAATSAAAKVLFGSKGSYRVRVYHADANHLTSYSSYKYVTVK